MTVQSFIPPLVPERPEDGPAIDALIDRAFGPGRYAKAAERLRGGNRPLLALSMTDWADGRPIGCARLWPIAVGETPALLLGPFAVEDAHRRQGLGAALIRRACETAADAGHAVVLLVGDEAYFATAGFAAAPARRVAMPGPVDQRRVLARALTPGAADRLIGPVTAQPARARAFHDQPGSATD
jgi:predicted N-acetyltransferase YhbS